LENLNSELENRNSELALQNDEYARMNVELERNNEELLQERSLLEEQKREVETLLMEVSDRLTVTEYSIKEKAELTDKIMLLLQNELMVRGVSYEMNADHDAFVFYVDELYDEDRIQLSDEGRAMVSAFFKAYIEILLTSEYKDRLDLYTFVCVMPNEGVYRMNVNYGIKYASDTASYCASAYERAKDIYDRLFISTHVDNNAEKSIIELGFTLNTVE
jgi:hypothetical protein